MSGRWISKPPLVSPGGIEMSKISPREYREFSGEWSPGKRALASNGDIEMVGDVLPLSIDRTYLLPEGSGNGLVIGY
ncbi:hypothetical protein AVEN_216582-1 [Araneus ventricosus]|uniref:Uncharacterized protein n=2 Tax=Araneus ventricosus TaxID=182803 RepID=A0A4Y2W5R9_ARAVE|nr:hypothetical protein AVEN_216582-1 [Araneus ventricosus]